MHGQTADNCVSDEPPGGRTEVALDDPKAERARHRVKDQRSVSTQFRAPTCPQTRARCLQRLIQRTRFNWRAMEIDSASTRDQVDFCPSIEKQRGHVDG